MTVQKASTSKFNSLCKALCLINTSVSELGVGRGHSGLVILMMLNSYIQLCRTQPSTSGEVCTCKYSIQFNSHTLI